MEKGLLKDFAERIEREKLNVFGVVVRQNNVILDTHDFGEPKGRIQLFSASKTWTSMAIGIAEGEGLLKLNDKVADILRDELPENCAEGFERLTVWHLLTMSTGHETCPAMRVMAKLRESGDFPPKNGAPADIWFNAFCTEPLVYDPDDGHFVYNNAATYMLSCIITKLTGESLRDYLMPRVFTPLGIEDPHWDCDSKGRSTGAIGLYLNTEELSRGGQLLLDHGRWEGKQLIPEDYAIAMGTKQVRNDFDDPGDPEGTSGYGYQLWMCSYPGAYRMDGMGAKYCIQLPDLDAVVCITSHEMERGFDILRAVWDEIVPKLKAEA